MKCESISKSDMLETKALSCGYDQRLVVKDVTLEVARGRTVVLVGRNASGKSTLLKCIAGLVQMQSGRILFGGAEMAARSTWERARCGLTLVPQTANAFSNLTISQHLRLPIGVDKEAAQERLEKILRLFPILSSCLGRRVQTLSAGERQLLSVGEGLVRECRWLMLDEPFAGVAPPIAERMQEVLLESVETHRIGCLVVEQDLYRAIEIGDLVMVMKRGRLIECVEGDISVSELRSLLR